MLSNALLRLRVWPLHRALTPHTSPTLALYRSFVQRTPHLTRIGHERTTRIPPCRAMATNVTAETITYLGQQQAIAVDEELMGPLGFSVDQLMELAGLSVAHALAAEYPAATCPRVLVLAGPGNNGGDGLVAARHLHHLGYALEVVYPKQTDRPLYRGLVTQLQSLGVPFVEMEDVLAGPLSARADVVIDALFGFSFKGQPRAPFDALLEALKPSHNPPPTVSVDIPSGWDVEGGDTTGQGIQPAMLVSLTAPKMAARAFRGVHYLGGRFVPPAIKDKHQLHLPPYPGTAQCVRIASADTPDGRAAAAMRISYGEGADGLLEGELLADPMQQFGAWFAQAAASSLQEPNAMTIASCGGADGEVQPSARMVLLKGFDERGFVFYTNYTSRKGRELEACPRAALVFWWEPLQKSVRVEGTVERVPEAESDEYFNSRPRGSRIGALVSPQSTVLAGGRDELEARAAALQGQYADEAVPVPRPAHWGGYLVRPQRVEFWQGRPSRLHDRLVYEREDGQWVVKRLAP